MKPRPRSVVRDHRRATPEATLQRAVNLGTLLLLLAVGTISLDRALRARYDFHHFYLDARYVWEHQQLIPLSGDDRLSTEKRQLPFYLPVVPLALSPLTAFGPETAAVLWAAGQVAALGYCLRVLRCWAGAPHPTCLPTFGILLLLAIPAGLEAGKFNQLSFLVLALVCAAFEATERRRPWLAGTLFATATVLKLLPGIFCVWLLLKRQWSALAAFVIAGVVLTFVPPLVVFGPSDTRAYHGEWWQHNVAGDSARGLLNPTLAQHFVDRRNQSIPQVVARLAWAEHPHAAAWQPLHVTREVCMQLALAVTALLAGALVFASRRPAGDLDREHRRAEFSAFAIGMLVFSPLLRQYYLVWALPAVLMLARAAARPEHWRSHCGWSGLAVWLLGMIAWGFEPLRVLGAHLLMLIALGALVLLAWPVVPRADGAGRAVKPRCTAPAERGSLAAGSGTA